MADLLRRVHRVDHEGLPDTLPRRDSPLPDLDQFVEVAVFDRVTQRWSGGRPGVLLHGDYWPGNLLWRGEQIVALVDWEDAAIGDPFSDLACARVELLCTVGEEVMERFTEQYLRLAGPFAERDTADLVAWDV